MVASFVIALIVGILLALRFKVFVLVPATLLAAVAIIASGHQPKVTLALTLLGTVVLLQIGYLVGLIVRAHLQKRRWKSGLQRFLKVDRALSFMAMGQGDLKWLRMYQVSKLLASK